MSEVNWREEAVNLKDLERFSYGSLDFCDKKKKIKSINNADFFPQPSSIIFTKGTNNSDHVCI